MNWEYRILNLDGYNDEGEYIGIENRLNEIGKDGWELAAIDDGAAYFKRPRLVEELLKTYDALMMERK